MSLMCVEELRKVKDELSVAREDVLRREDGIAEGCVRIWASDVVIKVAEANRLISHVAANMPCPLLSYANKVSNLLYELIALKHRAPRPRDFAIHGLENRLQELSKCLIADGVESIGIWGMGGIGKTALMTKLYYECLSHFEFVVWLQVSQEVKVEDLQVELGKQIGVYDVTLWKGKNFHHKAALISQFLHGKKILVLLDDLWNRVELQDIGISHNSNCQIVFTTRSKAACTLMDAQRTFKLKPLSWELAWRLFQDRIGVETLAAHPDVETIARGLVRECLGLPLALVSCALSLSSSFLDCKHSVETFKNFAFRHVFSILKSSYDFLPHPYMKSCLLYCALFPKCFDIPKDELIDKWICEGFLDDEDPFTMGYRILGALVDLSLLEDQYEVEAVRMNDVTRDMCLWIACEVEGEKQSYFVQSDDRFGRAPPVGGWEDARIISLMRNKGSLIQRRVEACVPPPHLSTLLLSCNRELEEIILVVGFIRYTKTLTVLDLSETGLTVFPVEISELVSLQYLDISHTKVETLPGEVLKLERLKCFNLEFTRKLRDIPRKLIASLKLLQVFRILGSNFILDTMCVAELERLESLKALSITIRDADIYHNVLSSYKLSKCIQSLFLEDLEPPYGELLGTGMESSYCICKTGYFDSLRRVNISCCHYLQNLTWVIRAPNLTKLIVRYCENLEEISNEIGGKDLSSFSKIQEIQLIGLPNLKRICREPKLFPNLTVIRVCGCLMLKKLPLNAKSAKGCNLVIEGTLDWWMELRWEDEATRTAFKSSYDDIIWFKRRDGTCTAEDRSRIMQHRRHSMQGVVDQTSENMRNTVIGRSLEA